MNSIHDGTDNLGMNEKPRDDDLYDEDANEKKPGTSTHLKYGEFSNPEPETKKVQRNQPNSEDASSFYGIEKSLYRKSEATDLLPKTGTDFTLLPCNPELIRETEPFEPLYAPEQYMLEECLKREAEKLCFHETLMNRVVYDCVDPSFYTKSLNPKDYDIDVMPFYMPSTKEDITLVFESRFESGNLRRAIQIYDNEYNLILKPDYFTRGHTQWYYFSVANTRKDKEYRFNIINMMKPDSLYNGGMKPLVYSNCLAKNKKVGWHRDGYEICYYQNYMKRKNAGYYYTLTFTVKFKYDYDTVYFAHCYPYTYSDLCRYISVLEEDPERKTKVKRKPLCQTIAGNNCDMLTVTNFANENEVGKDKKCIVITSRVHPGESNSSFVMEGIIDFLTGSSIQAKQLRDNFVFRIVPMLNPDGVINGNYRCNLAGCDLNRQWIDPSKKLHPTIFNTKLMIRKAKEEKEVLLYVDIHGHSRKKNIFLYGCSGKDNKKREQIFPLLFRNTCDFFSYKDCNFAVQRDRESTARVNVWRELSLAYCYTLELSFCGADFGKYEYFHFTPEMFNEMAVSFCQAILDLNDPDQMKVRLVMEEIEQNISKAINADKKDTDKLPANQDDQDSDYSNDDGPIKDEKQTASNPTANGAQANSEVAGSMDEDKKGTKKGKKITAPTTAVTNPTTTSKIGKTKK